MEKKSLIKEKTIIEAQKYELDKQQIMKFYGIKEKLYTEYNVVQKKIIFSKESSVSKIDKKLKYSNYQTFRQLLLSEYNLEEMKEEFEKANELIQYSEKLRGEMVRYFGFGYDRFDDTSTNYTDTSSNEPKKKLKTMIQTVMFADDFLKRCRLLKLKQRKEKEPIQTGFKLFSDLDKPSDPFSMHNIRDEKLFTKFLHQKEKLLQGYNREYQFTSYISKIQDGLIKPTPDSLYLTTKDKFSSEPIDALFDSREKAYYYDIDKFVNSYGITPFKVRNEEKDLYEKIYGILSKNNYMNFLSFLYSQNKLFKFIYDEFSDKDATLDYFDLDGNTFADRNMEELRHVDLRDSDISARLNDTARSFLSWKQRHSTVLLKKNTDIYEQLAGCYAFLRIGIVTDYIKPGIIDEFFCNTGGNDSKDYVELRFFNFLERCSKVGLDFALLIDREKKLKIFSPDITIDQNNLNSENPDIFALEESMSNVVFYKVLKSDLKTKLDPPIINAIFSDKENSNPLYPSSFFYYLIKITYPEDENSTVYYLFKIPEKYADNFEAILNKKFNLNLSTKIKKQNTKKPSKESESEDGLNEDDLGAFLHGDAKRNRISMNPTDSIDEVTEVIKESCSNGPAAMKSENVQSPTNKIFGSLNDTFHGEGKNEFNNESLKGKPEENENEDSKDKQESSPNSGSNKMSSVRRGSGRDKDQASILNSSSLSDTSNASGIKNVIKENNMKKTEAYQIKNKDY